MVDVLNTDIDPLGQDLAAELLVHNDTNSMLCHVEDTASLTMVKLMWHTLLEGTVTLDINDISLLVNFQEG